MLALMMPAAVVQAIESFVVKDIRVDGLQRIAPGTIFNYLPVKVGDTLTEDSARQAIQALFKTGFFEDVRLERSENTLVVHVTERPSIDSIQIRGTKDIDEKTLKQGFKDIGLSEGRVFNSSLLDKMEQELKRQYFGRGRYSMTVKTTVTPLERNRVAIRIDVNEGEVAKIRSITFVGNNTFDDSTLRGRFTLTTPTLFSFITKNDQYSKQQLSADLESLRSFYQNQGYLDFSIDSTQVAITPDRQDISVTISLTEGKKYTVREVKLAGKFIVPEDELRKLVHIQPGDVFSRQEVTDSSKRISDRLGNDGYAFANVNPVPDIDREKGTVGFTFFIDPGQRVYVRRINFSGNLSTNDEVLRREMRQVEGAWYSTEKIQRSRVRLQRLGFFEDINIETPPVPGSPDQVDLNVTVKERLVNQFMFGIGYSDAEGLLINANVNLKNVLGTGNEMQLSADSSKVNRHVNLSYVEPYYTADGISRTSNIYSTNTDASQANTAAYTSDTRGIGMTFGIPISESRSISLGMAYESINIEIPTTGAAQIATDFVTENGLYPNRQSKTDSLVKLITGWAHDTLDNPIFPNNGTVNRITLEASVPGGDMEYYRISWTGSLYYTPVKDLTLKLKASLDYGEGYGDTSLYPFYKNFYAGGSSSVRGYQSRSLGPTDVGAVPPADPTLPVGGNKRVLGNAEVLFPFPGAADNKSLRLSLFVDAGMVYGYERAVDPMTSAVTYNEQKVDLSELRYSSGIALNWFSPIGPISLSYAVPLNEQPGDKIENVQFTLGQSFR